jgi:hypothetical protein
MNVKNFADVIAGAQEEPFSPQEVAFFMRNAYEFHPNVVAEILQDLNREECEPYTTAYRVVLSGIRELAKFLTEEPRLSGTSPNDFFIMVAQLKGDGSSRVQSDVIQLLNENIAAAEEARFGKADAVEYTKRLGNILENGSADTIRLHFQEDSSFIITTTFQHLLRHHPQGLKVIGNVLATLTIDSAKVAKSKSSEDRSNSQLLGKVLGYVENALDAEVKNRNQRIQKGSEIVKFMADAVMTQLPESCETMTKVKSGMVLSQLQLPGVKLSLIKFRADIHRVVNETYRQTVDPRGFLVSGSLGEQAQKNYLDSFTDFETSMMWARENVLRLKPSNVPVVTASAKL